MPSAALGRILRFRPHLALPLVALAAAAPAAVAAPRPSVEISAPATATADAPVAVSVSLRGVQAISAFEATVLVNGRAVEVIGGAPGRTTGLRPLSGVDSGSGVSFGGYRADRAVRAGNGRIVLGQAVIRPVRTGRIQVRLAAVVVVDSKGRRIVPRIARATDAIQVGRGRLRFKAPHSSAGTAPLRGGRAPQADVNYDGRVTRIDGVTVRYGWETARLAGDVCGTSDPGDVNRDGCVDVLDLLRVDARLGEVVGDPVASLKADPPVTYTVNSALDTPDANPGDGVCATATGVCTLRAAIEEANRKAGLDYVAFAIPGAGPHTITIGSTLPLINNLSGGTVIDGTTQPGATANTDPLCSNAEMRVNITAVSGLKKAGLFLASPNNVVRGLTFSGRMFRPIMLDGFDAHHNQIVGNWVGFDASQQNFVTSNSWGTNGTGAILLNAGANRNQIGTPAPADRNFVGGNPAHGIYLNHEFVTDNLIQNNVVGLGPRCDRKIGNRIEGIDLNYGASRNLIGGLGPGERNVVSGGAGGGIELSHGWNYNLPPRVDVSDMYVVRDNVIAGNYVGIMPDGSYSQAISRNGGIPILVQDVANYNTVTGNVVATTTQAQRTAVHLTGDLTFGNVVEDNYLGVRPDGVTIGSGNYGVLIDDSGAQMTVRGNRITSITQAGVRVPNGNNDLNRISRNAIYGLPSAALGIDLQVAGPDVNDIGDADDGANQQLNYPVISEATDSAVYGTACAGCTVELFRSDRAAGAYGPGAEFLLATTADAVGLFGVTVPGLQPGQVLTATATDAQGNTSEFALNVAIGDAPAPGTPIAADAFARTVAGGWGTAPLGGAWKLQGTPADFAVGGGAGTERLGAGTTREAYLDSDLVRDVEATARVATDKAAAGGNQFVYLAVRRDATGAYRAKLRFATDGRVYLQLLRGTGNAETSLGAEQQLAGLTHGPGVWFRIRLQAVGANPTTLRARVWADGAPEPADWSAQASDSAPERQIPGGIALRAYVGGPTTNAPVLASWDDLEAHVAAP